MSDISRDEFERLYQTIDAGFKGVHERLDTQNGRVGRVEQKVAVLEDRSNGSGKGAAVAGGGVGLFVVAAFEAAKAWLTR